MTSPRILDAPSPNFDDRGGAPIDTLIFHYTGMARGTDALRRLIDPAPTLRAYTDGLAPQWITGDLDAPLGRVSAHYLIDEEGQILRLVPETARAWHAGISYWRGARDLNARSIGIEVQNGGHDFSLPGFTPAQLDAMIALGRDILGRWPILPERVLGHQDVAPERKRDPGPEFPWARLAHAGVGLPPVHAGIACSEAGFDAEDDLLASVPAPAVRAAEIARVQGRLAAWGYETPPTGELDPATRANLGAFLEHWGRMPRPADDWPGVPRAFDLVMDAMRDAAAP